MARLVARTLLAALPLLLLAPAGAAASAHTQAPVTRLSDERTLSRWAHTNLAAPVRRQPSTASKTITRLRFWTEHKYAELYLALRELVDADGRTWVQIRLPRRPNGTTGWVPREALGEWRVVRTQLVVDRRRLRATLYRSGRRIWSARVGVGKRGTPTPSGRFYAREKLYPDPRGFYGPVAIGTSGYAPGLTDWPKGGVVGIHGTSLPGLLPGRVSNGCVRVRNDAIRRLARLMPIGTPVRIR